MIDWLDEHGIDLAGLALVIVFYAAFFLARYVITKGNHALAAFVKLIKHG